MAVAYEERCQEPPLQAGPATLDSPILRGKSCRVRKSVGVVSGAVRSGGS